MKNLNAKSKDINKRFVTDCLCQMVTYL